MAARSTELGTAIDGFLKNMALAQQMKRQSEAQAYANEANAALTMQRRAPTDAMMALGDALKGGMPLGDVMTNYADAYLVSGVDPSRLSVFTQEDADRAMLQVASGKPIGVNDAFSLGDRDAVAGRNLAADLQREYAKPVQTSAGGMTTFGAGDPRASALGDQIYGPATKTTAQGAIINDLAAGKAVPPLAAATVFPQSGSGGSLGNFGPTVLDPTGEMLMPLMKAPANDAQQTLISNEQFKGTMGRYRNLVEQNPQSIGLVGLTKGLVQDVQGQADALAQTYGFTGLQEGMATARADLQRFGVEGVDDYFDASIPQVQQMGLLMAYSAAAAVADQTGRGLSNNDLNLFRTIVGNPQAWMTSQKSVLAKLDTLEAEVDARIAAHKKALRQGVDIGDAPLGDRVMPAEQQSAPQPAPQNAPQTNEADYVFNPTTRRLEPRR